MIYVTGDCHGDFKRFSTNNFPDGRGLTENDFVIVCGDFGYWHDTPDQRWWIKWLTGKPWTTLFVDGNHENFDALNSMKVEEWNGGKIHRITDKIIHLMRGQIFTLQGKTFFAFGGAASHDIQDGIIDPNTDGWLEKAKQWQKEGKYFRINHYTWWKEEMPSKDEMDDGRENLCDAEYAVDFIITHDCPASTLITMYGEADINELNRYFEDIYYNTNFKRWYFGHHHVDWAIGNTVCLYETIERIV